MELELKGRMTYSSLFWTFESVSIARASGFRHQTSNSVLYSQKKVKISIGNLFHQYVNVSFCSRRGSWGSNIKHQTVVEARVNRVLLGKAWVLQAY
jgi:hypothetical protein